MTEFVEKKYVKNNSIEQRDYQINLANQAINENCIVVLPTGLGKTAVALHVIAEYLSKGTDGILFLAPTRVLVHQHYEFLKNLQPAQMLLVQVSGLLKTLSWS